MLQNEISKFNLIVPDETFDEVYRLTPDGIDENLLEKLSLHLEVLDEYYSLNFTMAMNKREALIINYMKEQPGMYNHYKDTYHNESVGDHVRKVYEKNEMVEYNNELIQQIDPVYLDPFPSGWLSFRSHFFAPRKYFAGKYIDTYWFNIDFIWFLSLLFYILLYYNVLHKLIHLPEKFKFRS